eukprot:TRINITY_DN66186_c6_g4_i1.p1 TRINITY_DN66186_c6_g4~~TRINITY_DN66186_c6_g4_i1.p1  ORF type:complete len:552 (+),score=303.21 TRINITY_DN66186_c6_g4_i1:3-1658(+)
MQRLARMDISEIWAECRETERETRELHAKATRAQMKSSRSSSSSSSAASRRDVQSYHELSARLLQLRTRLQALFQTVLLRDLEFAHEHKVPQSMWLHVYHAPLAVMRKQLRSLRSAGSAGADTRRRLSTVYQGYIDTGTQCFSSLLRKHMAIARIARVGGRDDDGTGPFVDLLDDRNAALAATIDNNKNNKRVNNNDSLLQLLALRTCRDCLLYMGDLQRYANRRVEAEQRYHEALELDPDFGNPFNQLAVLADQSDGDALLALHLYFRSLAVRDSPFEAARRNIHAIVDSNRRELERLRRRAAARATKGVDEEQQERDSDDDDDDDDDDESAAHKRIKTHLIQVYGLLYFVSSASPSTSDVSSPSPASPPIARGALPVLSSAQLDSVNRRLRVFQAVLQQLMQQVFVPFTQHTSSSMLASSASSDSNLAAGDNSREEKTEASSDNKARGLDTSDTDAVIEFVLQNLTDSIFCVHEAFGQSHSPMVLSRKRTDSGGNQQQQQQQQQQQRASSATDSASSRTSAAAIAADEEQHNREEPPRALTGGRGGTRR